MTDVNTAPKKKNAFRASRERKDASYAGVVSALATVWAAKTGAPITLLQSKTMFQLVLSTLIEYAIVNDGVAVPGVLEVYITKREPKASQVGKIAFSPCLGIAVGPKIKKMLLTAFKDAMMLESAQGSANTDNQEEVFKFGTALSSVGMAAVVPGTCSPVSAESCTPVEGCSSAAAYDGSVADGSADAAALGENE
jgi:hypothetical protein